MSYRVLTGPAIPFVHALPSGLGASPEAPAVEGPWYGQILAKIADPLSSALSQRIAYGKTDPYGGYYGTPQYYTPSSPYGYSSFSGFGGISPTVLLVGGAALLAVMMLGRK